MKKLERILLMIAAFGLMFKLLNFPLSGLLLFISLMILGSLYFYLGFALFNNIPLKHAFKSESYKEIKTIQVVLSVCFGLGLSILIIGILFTLQNYPMQRIFISIGIITTALFLLLNLIVSRAELKKQNGKVLRAAVFIIIGVILLIIPPYSLDKIQYRNHPGYVEALIKLEEDPNNEELIKQFEKERLKMILGDEYAKFEDEN
jgi:uncharacterized membrane protein